MSAVREHAVVIGASMAGLLAARVLSETSERVTVIDRDLLPGEAGARRGVPQGRHPHALLVRGKEVLEELFPGLATDLLARGALTGDMQADVRWYNDGHLLRQQPIGIGGLAMSRPLLEDAVRARVRALPGVQICEGTDSAGPVLDGDRVTGVRVLTATAGAPTETVLPADLVVDAGGRGSHTPQWLAAHGYQAPAETRIRVDVRYATWVLPRHADDLGGDVACVIAATVAAPRFGVALPIEGDRWLVTAGGYSGEAAPADRDEFRAFLTRLPAPDLAPLLDGREPLEPPRRYSFPHSMRRHYERLDRFPAGLVVMGDALSSFNPVYGQGMTVAAVEALQLRRLLSAGTPDLPRAFHRGAARVVDVPWDMAAGADLRLPGVVGDRPLRARLVNGYLARLQAAAAVDGELGAAFLRVVNLLDPPPALLRPAVVRRVLRAGRQASGRAPAAHEAARERAGMGRTA
ncbi:FAD-dependent oxidoreductase [Blastococcus sp. SYSU D00820]